MKQYLVPIAGLKNAFKEESLLLILPIPFLFLVVITPWLLIAPVIIIWYIGLVWTDSK